MQQCRIPMSLDVCVLESVNRSKVIGRSKADVQNCRRHEWRMLKRKMECELFVLMLDLRLEGQSVET